MAHHADVGIALDGDADRVVLVCEQGRLVDGDQLMATIANRWAKDGRLVGAVHHDTFLQHLGMGRSALGVDVEAVGRDGHRDHLGAELPQHRRRDLVGLSLIHISEPTRPY